MPGSISTNAPNEVRLRTFPLIRMPTGYFCGSAIQGSSSVCFMPSETFSSVSSTFNTRSEEHTSELQSQSNLVCRLLLEKKKNLIACANYTASQRLRVVSLNQSINDTLCFPPITSTYFCSLLLLALFVPVRVVRTRSHLH